MEVKNCTRLVKNHVTSTNTSQSQNTSSHSSIEPSNISSKHCLIFRHLSSGLSLIFNHKSYVKFGCDFENICQEKNTGKFIKVNTWNWNCVQCHLYSCDKQQSQTIRSYAKVLISRKKVCQLSTGTLQVNDLWVSTGNFWMDMSEHRKYRYYNFAWSFQICCG